MIAPGTPTTESAALGDFAKALAPSCGLAPPRISLREGDVRNGLGKLVLTLVELLRQLLERQAIRRIEAESLTDAEVERLGTTFMGLADQVETMRKEFGLDEDDLNIDLGPLGRLL